MRRPTGVVFDAHNLRPNLFPIKDQTTFYDYSKDKVMGRLTRGYSNFKTQKSRESPHGLGLKLEPSDSYDYRNAVEAHTTKTKPKTIALTNFKKQQSRDDKLLRSTDGYANVELENTREERELELQARKEHAKRYHNLDMF